MMFGTNVCGFRSYSGNQLDCTSTIIRCPFKNVWSAPCRLHLYSFTSPGFTASGVSKLFAVPPPKDLLRNHQLVPRHPPGASSGYTSISFTTQSASVPVVAANRSAITSPVTVTSWSSTGVEKFARSFRPLTNL